MSGRIRFACLLALGCALTLALASTAVAVPNKFDDYVRTPAEDVLGDPIGTAPSATIEAVTADALGNLYYTETDFFTAPDRVVRRSVDGSRTVLSEGDVAQPSGVAVSPDGTVWVTDLENSVLVEISAEGSATAWGGPGEPEPGDPASNPSLMNSPGGVAVGSDGIVYVVDSGNSRLLRFDPTTDEWLTPLGSPGVGSDNFTYPEAATAALGRIYVSDAGNNRITVWDCATATNVGVYTFLDQFEYGLNNPSGVAVDAEGTMYVADSMNARFARINSAGRSLGSWPKAGDQNPLDSPYEIATVNGNVIVADIGGAQRPSSLRTFDFVPGIPDTTPPYTGISGLNGLWDCAPRTVSLKAVDTSSTVTGTWFSLDGSFPTIPYTGSFVLSEESTATMRYYSTDDEGNVETVKSMPVMIDLTDPASWSDATDRYFGQAVITLSGSDALSGLNAVGYQLDGGSTVYDSEVRLSNAWGPHELRYWAVDEANNVEPSHVVTFTLDPPDDAAPTTIAHGVPTGWATESVDVTLSASDDGVAGVAATYYRINGGPIQTYTGAPIRFVVDGDHDLTFWSVDDNGNLEAYKHASVKVDCFAPSTFGDVAASYNTTPTVVLVPADQGSGVVSTKWRHDGGPWQDGTEMTGSTVPGDHTFEWYSVDAIGKTETVRSASYTYINRVEQDDPRVVFTPGWTQATNALHSGTSHKTTDAAGSAFMLFNGTRVEIVGARGPNMGIARVSIDGGTPVDVDMYAPQMNYQAEVFGVDVAAGQHRVRIDWTGTKNPASVGTIIGVDAIDLVGEAISDTAPPTLEVTGAPTGWTSSNVSLTLTANDVETYISQLRAAYDGGASQPCGSPYTMSSEGEHTAIFEAVDGAGNHSAEQTVTVRIDRTAPVTTDDASVVTSATYQYSDVATITLSPTDSMSGVSTTYWRLDGGAWNAGTNVIISQQYGSHVLQYYSTDIVGNVELTKSLAFEIIAPDSDFARDDPAIVYHDDWAWGVPNAWSDNGYAKVANQSGASVLATFNGYRIRWRAQKGPNMGKAYVQVDNGTVYTVDLYNSYVYTGATVFDSGTIPNGTHRISIRWTGLKRTASTGTQISLTRLTVSGGLLTETEDVLPPTTTSDAPSGWVEGPVTVGLSSQDATSGVKGVYMTTDGSAPTFQTPYAGPVQITAEGTTTLKYFAEDNRDNVEEVGTDTVQIDNTAPVTTAVGLQSSYRTGADIQLDATDPYSGVASTSWRIDGGEWQSGTTMTVPDVAGYHDLEWYSTDNIGHVETVKSAEVLVTRAYEENDPKLIWQKTWSTVSTEGASGGAYKWIDGTGTMYSTFSGTEFALIAPKGPGFGKMRVTVDGANPVDVDLYAATAASAQRVHVIRDLTAGTHRVRVDWLGTKNAASSGTRICVDAFETSGSMLGDTTPPTLSLGATVPDGVWTKNSAVTITPFASDADSYVTLTATIGNGTPTVVTGPFNVTAEGDQLVTVDAVDGGGNHTTVTHRVKIDRTGPTASDNAPVGWQTGNVNGITLSANDTLSGVDRILFSTDGGAPSAQYTGPFNITAEGTTTLKYRGVDEVENFGTIYTKYVRIDKTAPVTNPSQAIASSYTSTATVNLVPTDPNSGVAYTKWRVDGSAWTTGTAVTVPNLIGPHTIEWYSVDNVGRVESTKSATATVLRRVEQVNSAIYFQGSWSTVNNAGLSGGSYRTTSSGGTAVDFSFTGTRVDWITSKNTNYGKATLTLDDGPPVEVDLYGSLAFQQRVWTSGTLSEGEHKVHIDFTGARNPSSTGIAIGVDAFDIIGDVLSDSTPPSTTINVTDAWRSTPATVTLDASDAGTWVERTFYRLDGGEATTYTAPFVVGTEGTSTVEYWSVDGNGNVESAKTQTVRIDTTAPEVTHDAPEGWVHGPVDVRVSATDAGSGLTALLASTDGSDPSTASPATIAITAEGTTMLRYRATDAVSNSTAVLETPVRIDNSPPTTTDNAPTGWVTSATITLSAADTFSGVLETRYRVDGGEEQVYSGPVQVSDQGTHWLSYYSVDEVGNVEDVRSTFVQIDRFGPMASDDAPAGWQNRDIDVILTAADDHSGVASILYSTDGTAPDTEYTAPIRVSAEGTTTITYRAIDGLGNPGPDKTATVLVDKTAPVTSPSSPFQPVGYSLPTTLQWQSTDARSGTAWTNVRVDGGDWHQVSAVAGAPYGELPEAIGYGDHTIEWFSVDHAGNSEGIKYASTTLFNSRVEQSEPGVYFRGSWALVNHPSLSAGSFKSTSTQGAEARVNFDGTRLDWITSRNTNYGKARLTLDGGSPVEVDLYGPFAFQQRVWSSGNLTPGPHSLRIEFTGSRNASSTGTGISIDGFDVIGTISQDTASPSSADDASGAWRSMPATVTISASDEDTWVEATRYRVDGGNVMSYAAPIVISDEGTTDIDYWSVDGAGNSEATKTATIRIDTTAPTVSTDAPADWTQGPVTVHVSATDAGSGLGSVAYSTDGSEPVLPYADGVTIIAEGETTLRYRATDLVGNATAIGESVVRIDNTAPVTSDDAPAGWMSGDQLLTLTAADPLSGVSSTQYSLDGTVGATYEDPIAISGEGVHTVEYASTDNAGNAENPKTATIRIDNTAPTTTSNAATSYNGSASIALSASDNLSGVSTTEWRLDGGAWSEGPIPTIATGGAHTLEWRSTDAAGHTEQTKSATFVVTKGVEQTDPSLVWKGTWSTATHPNLSGGSYAYSYTAGSSVSFAFDGVRANWITSKSSNYGKARVTVDGGTPVDVDLYSPTPAFKQLVWSSGDLADGLHTVKIEYTGTRNASSAGYTIGLDALDLTGEFVTDSTAPTTQSNIGSSGWSTNPVQFALTATDGVSGVESTKYRLNGGTTYTYADPVTVSSEGTTTVSFWSVDRVGNIETANAATVRVDTLAPSTTAAVSSSYVSTATISLQPTDATSGVARTQWRLDGGAWTDGTSVACSALGNHTLEYRSTDAAGNIESVNSATFTVLRRYEQTDDLVALGGTWSTVNHASLSAGSYAGTYADGSFAQVTFTGTRLDWITSKSASNGTARVRVDGGEWSEVDLYASSAQFKQRVWSSGDLTSGTHTVRIEYTGTKNASSAGTNIGVDAFDVVGTLAVKRYEQSDSTVVLQGTWGSVNHASLSGGSYTYTYTNGSTAYISFVGTKLDWYTSKSVNYGKARVSVDGTSTVDVDLYASSAQFKQKVWSTGNLPKGLHTVKIENVGAKNPASTGLSIGVDAVDVSGALTTPTVSAGTRFEQTDTKIAFGGSWSTVNNASLSGGSHTYTSSTGSAALVNFTGTKIEWIGSKSSNYGKARVILDGGAPVEVDLYSSSAQFKQRIWSSGDLTSGAHTLRIEYTGAKNAASSGTVVGIDAVDVTGTLSQATIGPTLTRYEQGDSKLAWSGTWSTVTNGGLSGGSFASANSSGATVVAKFSGTKATLVCSRNTSYGIARITVDGGTPVDVDLYGTFGFQQKLWTSPDLTDGEHTVRIEWTGTKNPASTGTSVNVDALEITGTLQQAP